MTTLIIENCNTADLLCHTAAHRTGMQPDKFSAEICDCIDSVLQLLGSKPTTAGFDNAYYNVTKAVVDYDQKPDLEGIGKIGKELDRYRTEALARAATTPSSLTVRRQNTARTIE
jgi:peptidoglycan/xylan/chitin deacetylase (PgdA/CDA1 family)